MTRQPQLCRFGPFDVDLTERQVKRGSEVLPLPGKAFELLTVFLGHPGRTLSKTELMNELWPGTVVEEGNLSQTVFLLRKALGETATSSNYIATVPRRGYRFVADIIIGEADPPPSDADAAPRVRRSPVWSRLVVRASRPRTHAYVVAVVTAALALSVGVTPGRGPFRLGRASVAVLPFVDSSADKSLGYFCDGLTEQLLSVLARIDGLRVPGRSSSFHFRGTKLDPKEIGTRLHVEHILEGSVRAAGDRLRVTTRLTAVSTGVQLWAQTYERALRDLFALEDEISRAVANALRVRVLPEAERRPTEDSLALQLYMRGRRLWFENEFDSAADHFRRAIERDPGFALAYAGLARTYARMEGPDDALRRAEDTARRALEIDETLSEAALVLGTVRLRAWDWTGAEREFRRAVALNPRSAEAHGESAIGYLAPTGRMAEALRASARSLELEPVSPFEHIRHGVVLTYARRFGPAEAQLRLALEMAPEHARRHLGKLYLVTERYEQALELFANEPLWRAITLARAGRFGEARRARFPRTDAAHVALYEAALGDRGRAFQLLEQARAANALALTSLVSPVWDPLRDDVRFRELARRIGLDGGVEPVSRAFDAGSALGMSFRFSGWRRP